MLMLLYLNFHCKKPFNDRFNGYARYNGTTMYVMSINIFCLIQMHRVKQQVFFGHLLIDCA